MRARVHIFSSIAVFLLAAWGLAGCGPKEDVVRIAVAVPLTGDVGTEGQGIRRAVELAVEEANAAQRFPFRLEVRALDDRADPKEAVNVANLIVSDPRIAAVIGHFNSGCAIPAARVYAKAGLPMVVPAATNPKVTQQQLEPDWTLPRIVFRVCPTDDVQGAYAGEFVANKLAFKKIAIVHDKTPYGQGLAEQVQGRFSALGGEVVSFDGVSVGDKDYKALLTRIKGSKPQALYFGGLYTEGGLILKQMRELGLGMPFISGDGSKSPDLYAVAGESADGAYLSMVGIPVEFLPSAKTFMESYMKRWGPEGQEIKPFDHFGYESAQVVLDALAKTGPDRAKLIEEIRKTDRQGVLGRTKFDDKGDTTNQIVTMTKAEWKTKSFSPIQ